MSVPKGPSKAQSAQDAKIEEDRIKFENERRIFTERAASYELASSATGRSQSFEYTDPTALNPNDFGLAGLFIPGKFDPSLNFDNYNTKFGPDLTWASAANLGYTPPEAVDWRAVNKANHKEQSGGFFGNIFGHAMSTLGPTSSNPLQHARNTARPAHANPRRR